MKKLFFKCLKVSAFLLFGSAIFSCNTKTVKSDEFETVLKIGDIALTKSQYTKQKNLFVGMNKIDTLKESQLQELNQSVIDDCYLTADAFSKGYHKNDTIIEVANAVAEFMLVKYDGYLWKQTKAKQTEVSPEEIKDIYDQPHIIYFLDAICFSKKLISDTTNDSKIKKIKNVADFDYYNSIAKKEKLIISSTMMSSWPVYELGQGNNFLKDAAIGSIIGPVRTLDGVVFAKLTKKDEVKKHSFKQEEERLKFVLNHLKTEKIVIDEQTKCEKNCKPKYDENNIAKFLKDKDNKDIQNDVLAEYFISGKVKKLTVPEFKSFLKYYVMQVKMVEPIDVKINIREKIGTDYLMVQVDSLNLRNEPLYIDEYNGYLRKLVLNQYITKELKPDLSNLDNEVKKYYEQNSKIYKEPEYLKVSCFEFNNLSNLLEAQEIIYKAYITGNESILGDSTLIRGLKEYQPDLTVSRNSNFLSTKKYDILLGLPFQTLSNEFAENGKFYLFYKKQKSGETLKPFDLVKEAIRNNIINNKKEAAKQQLLTQLKNKYKIELNKLETIQDIN